MTDEIKKVIGKKLKKVEGIKHDHSSPKEVRSHRELPTFIISANDLPEINEWDVLGKYKLIMEVEMTYKAQGKEYEFDNKDNKEVIARFKVKSIASNPGYGSLKDKTRRKLKS